MTPLPKAALAVVSAVSLGLGSAVVGVPAAQAAAPAVSSPTPDVAALAGDLAKQQLKWERCDFGLNGLKWALKPNIQCATVKVPRDWHNPTNGKTWSVRISRVKNVDPASPQSKGMILGNPGGPGGEGLVLGPYVDEKVPELRAHYNVVGMDPRGVGQSSQVSCTYTFDPNSSDPNAEKKAIGEQCSQSEDVRTITTEQTVYDMDFIRHLLGEKKLGYIGYSYGTWLGAWYGNVFAANAGPMVLDSSTDATLPTLQRTWEVQPVARDRQFDMHLMGWIARQDGTYHLGTNPDQIRERYFAAAERVNPTVLMLTWLLSGGLRAFPDNSQYPKAADVVTTIIRIGESGSSEILERAKTDPTVAAQQVLQLMAAEGKDPATRAAAAEQVSTLERLGQVKAQSSKTRKHNSAFDYIACGDGQWTQGEAYWKEWADKTAPQARLSASFGSLDVPVCAFWKTSTSMPALSQTQAKTLVIQSELDSQTGYELGYTTGTKLANTSAIFVDNEGSHGLFPYQTDCLDRPTKDFLLTGNLPKDITVCQAKPLPKEKQTFESWQKLDENGQHVPPGGALATPDTTAGPQTDINPVAAAAASQMSSQVRPAIQAKYGPEGVKILEEAGVLS